MALLHASISNLSICSYGNLQKYVCFIRVVKDWKLVEIYEFFKFLYSRSIGDIESDMMLWMHTESKKFSVQYFYKMLTV